jgi:hypothetical protein
MTGAPVWSPGMQREISISTARWRTGSADFAGGLSNNTSQQSISNDMHRCFSSAILDNLYWFESLEKQNGSLF